MTVGVVIVSFQCRDLLLECLDSIGRQAPSLLSRTVVVDNASSDGTVEALRLTRPEIRVIEKSRNVGFAAGANAGIRALEDCTVVCLLNPDAILLDSGILAAADYLETHSHAGVAGGRILSAGGTVQASARAFPAHSNAFFNRHSLATKLFPANRWSSRYLMTRWGHDDVRPVDWVSGAFFLIHRRALDLVGVLDAGYFFSIEDVDYCRRVHHAGLEVVNFPGACVQHRGGGSSRHAVYRSMYAHHAGMWRYYRKHLRGNRLLDALTFAGIAGRLGIHALSYTSRTTWNALLRRPNP